MSKYFIGFDTSAYTTSIAVVNEFGEEILDLREVLKVKEGSRGLRQQEAVFQHINNIPKMMEIVSTKIDIDKVESISASTKPRNIEGSYMPVFRVGEGQAFILSKVLNVKYNEFSHQDGHIASTFIGNNLNIDAFQKFLALHISGGTTELLKASINENMYQLEIVGGTKDISAGQLIDRIGVELGIKFPCGKEIDTLSRFGTVLDMKIPVSTKDTWLNFSGTETFFQRLIDKNLYTSSDISKSLLYAIGSSLEHIISNAKVQLDIEDVIITGGVASNSYIREFLGDSFNSKTSAQIFLPNIRYCTDNAVGIAYLGSRMWRKKNEIETIKGK